MLFKSAHICEICYPMKISLAWDEDIVLEKSLTKQPYDHVMSNLLTLFIISTLLDKFSFFGAIIPFKNQI